MFRPTLQALRASSFPAAIGLCQADISAIAAAANEAQERLLMDPMAPDEGWWGGWASMRFLVQSTNGHAYITTPQDIARLIVMDVCRRPVPMRNGFYEFLEFGRGLQPKLRGGSCGTCATNTQTFDRDSVVTLSDQTVSPAIIRFYPTDSADANRRVLVQGVDKNGMVVLGTDITTQKAIFGEYIALTVPFTDTINQYSRLTGFIKDRTLGPVTIFQVDPVTGAQTLLSSMDANEVTASYRRYLLNNLPNHCCNQPAGTVQIDAQAKLDFVPVASDPDYLLIQSIPALIEEAMAIKYSRMDAAGAPQLEAKHHAKALSILNGQLDHYEGKVSAAIKVPIFGSARLRPQPV